MDAHTLYWFVAYVGVCLATLFLYRKVARPMGALGVAAVLLLMYSPLEFVRTSGGGVMDWVQAGTSVVAILMLGRDRHGSRTGGPREDGGGNRPE